VGVSMDGPAFLHYAHRVTRTGLPRDQIPPEVPISRRAGVLSVRGRARASQACPPQGARRHGHLLW
jgi:hypothetical protein